MNLPPAAYERIMLPLQGVSKLRRSRSNYHTLPINELTWRRHADALVDAIGLLRKLLTPPPESFKKLQGWIQQLLRQRDRVAGLLLSLEPFEPYDAHQAGELLDLLDELPAQVIVAVESDSIVNIGVARALSDIENWWTGRSSSSDGKCLQRAFGMSIPLGEAQGSFRAEAVLQHYAYQNSGLLERLVPHLSSLGIPYVTDMLAGIFAVGQILDCDDPVVAYIALNTMVDRFLAADETIVDQTREHLRSAEPALHRGRLAAVRAYEAIVAETDDVETRALALADAYKRTVEGPFRQYGWAMHCLRADEWSTPPMLSSLRERLIAEGGMLASVAQEVVLPDMRNSETHETLAWDGFTNQFVTESCRLDVGRVAVALSVATSFVKGSEAGLAAVRSLSIQNDTQLLPTAEEEGRMPIWDRVRAFFGTNRLVLNHARLNSPHAHFLLQQLEHRDINPCLQALVLARRLLPRTETFEVSTPESDGPLIVVAAAALDATMPSWDYAVSRLDTMPLATFLPANLDARLRLEPEAVAFRSAAWIAVDDAIGVIDGTPANWNEDTRRLINTCLQVVEIAVASSRQKVGKPNARFESVQKSVAELRNWITSESPIRAAAADSQTSMYRLRIQWNRWGPAPRHPLVPEAQPTGEVEPAPAFRSVPGTKHYRTL